MCISVEAGDGEPCDSKDTRVIDVLETTEVPENGHVGIRASPLSWFNTSQQPSTTQPLPHSSPLPVGWGGESGKKK